LLVFDCRELGINGTQLRNELSVVKLIALNLASNLLTELISVVCRGDNSDRPFDSGASKPGLGPRIEFC